MKKILISISLLLFIAIIVHFLNVTKLNRETKITNFTIYYKSCLISETSVVNIKGERDTIKNIIDNIRRMESSVGEESYVIRRIGSLHRCFEMQELLEIEQKRLHKLDLIRPYDSRFICIVDYVDTKKDTIAFTPFGMYYNSQEYKINKEIIWYLSKFLPKYNRERIRSKFNLLEKPPSKVLKPERIIKIGENIKRRYL